MVNIAIFNAHLPENAAIARQFILAGEPVLLHSPVLTEELKLWAKSSFVQVRFCSPDDMAREKSVIIR